MKKRAKRTRAKSSSKRGRTTKRTTTAKIVTATKKSLRPVKRIAKKAAVAAGF